MYYGALHTVGASKQFWIIDRDDQWTVMFLLDQRSVWVSVGHGHASLCGPCLLTRTPAVAFYMLGLF